MNCLVRPAHALFMGALVALLIPVVSILILDRLGAALTRGATAGAAAAGCVAAGIGLALAWRRCGCRLRWSWPNAAELAVLAGALLGSAAYLLWLAGPPFLPVGTSVDGGWHYSLVDHIGQVRRLGVEAVRLSDVDSYTPGYHLLAFGLAEWLGAEPIYLIYPASVAVLALAIGATVQMAMDAVPAGAARPLAGIAALALLALLPRESTIEIITAQNFYPTAAGLAYLLAAGWAVGLLHRSGRRIAWLPLGLALLGIIICYPFWLPGALALVAAISVARHWRDWRALGLDCALLIGIVGLSLLLVHDLMNDQARQISNRMPDLGAAQVVGLAGLAIGGLAASRLLRRQPALPLAILGALALAQVIALGGAASYVGQKLLYSLPYTTAVAGIAAFGLLLGQVRRPAVRPALAAALTAGVLVAGLFGGQWRGLHERPFHPLSQDQVEAALWVRDRIGPDPDEVSFVVDYSITAYWIKVGLLRSLRGWSASSVLEYPPPRYDHWATDPATPQFAFVDNAEAPAEGLPARELHRRGPARFLERADAPPERTQVLARVYTAVEWFGQQETVRTAAYATGLPDENYRLWFVLTPPADGDTPPPELWRQPLDAQRRDGSRYGMVRIDPQTTGVSVWQAGQPAQAAVPPLESGQQVSGWMQLTYGDEPIATRRIYDLTIGDVRSLRVRDFNPVSIFTWAEQPLAGEAPAQPAEARFGDALAIERWELAGDGLKAGAAGELRLEWRSVGAVPPPARLFVHLLGADGSSYGVFDGEPHGGSFPFWLWKPGDLVRDTYPLNLPAQIPPGQYELVVGVYNPASGAALPISAGPATTREPAALLALVEVR